MAIGIALMLGIVLPQNFDAPYRATSLRDFWRRWHMTLSRFLRDYLYIPLGGNRHGLARQLGALLVTMGLGGLWHGAGFTFIAWGLLHGAGLSAEVIWRRVFPTIPRVAGFVFTFVFVTISWVFFRAQTFEGAGRLLAAMMVGPWGGEIRWRTLAAAAVIAILGPTAWKVALDGAPTRVAALATAGAFVIAFFYISHHETYQFIYFQF
jgi:D-alanyl-lipoteichoic acid acyltransferase DltB (MBOAT superfamily)